MLISKETLFFLNASLQTELIGNISSHLLFLKYAYFSSKWGKRMDTGPAAEYYSSRGLVD